MASGAWKKAVVPERRLRFGENHRLLVFTLALPFAPAGSNVPGKPICQSAAKNHLTERKMKGILNLCLLIPLLFPKSMGA